MVIVLDPFTNNDLCFPQAVKDFSIKQVVSEGAIKAFTKAILPRAAWFNISSFDPNTRSPTTELFSNKFWAVITSDVLGDAVSNHGVRQLLNHLD